MSAAQRTKVDWLSGRTRAEPGDLVEALAPMFGPELSTSQVPTMRGSFAPSGTRTMMCTSGCRQRNSTTSPSHVQTWFWSNMAKEW